MNEIVKIENNEIVVAPEVIEQIKEFEKAKARIDIMEKELKASLKNAMELKGIEKFIINGLCATIRKASTRTAIDSKRLKEECPDIYEEYSKTTPVASSITLTFED